MSVNLNNIAVLIDADNASANDIGQVLQEIEKYGTITCKKIYGDWGNAHIKSWQEALLKYAIDPMQQFAYVKGKNATDIGMVIEAMDLLYSNVYDGFCLISSDSDFTGLALRLRKNAVKVFGFGKRNTVPAFTQACDQFFYVEDLLSKQNKTKAATNLTQDKAKLSSSTVTRWTTKQLQTQTHLTSALAKLIKEDSNAVNSWSQLSYIASQIKQNDNIKLDRYGYQKFSELITALRLYDMRRENKIISIRLKNKKVVPTSGVDKNKTTSSKSLDKLNTVHSDVNLFSANIITIKIVTAPTIDVVIFRVDANTRVRGDEDMIFYGQTHSEDGSIELDQQLRGDKSIFEFNCDLGDQPDAIDQLNVALSTELDSLNLYLGQAPIELTITDLKNNTLLFSGEFDINNKISKSLLLCTLNRENDQWRFAPKHQSIDGDLRNLCEKYGIELSDD